MTVTVVVKGRQLRLPAVVLPCRVVGRDVLLGKTTPGLDVDWWIRSIGSTPENQPAPEESMPENREGPGIVDIKVLTRAQANRQRREIEGLELGDRKSGATPTKLDAYSDEHDEERDVFEEEESEGESEGEEEESIPSLEDIPSEPAQQSPEPENNPTITVDELPGDPYEGEHMDNSINSTQLRDKQGKDPSLRVIRELVKKGDKAFYYNKDKLLCKKAHNEFAEETELLVIPKELRGKAYKAAHTTLISGHLNYKYTLRK